MIIMVGESNYPRRNIKLFIKIFLNEGFYWPSCTIAFTAYKDKYLPKC